MGGFSGEEAHGSLAEVTDSMSPSALIGQFASRLPAALFSAALHPFPESATMPMSLAKGSGIRTASEASLATSCEHLHLDILQALQTYCVQPRLAVTPLFHNLSNSTTSALPVSINGATSTQRLRWESQKLPRVPSCPLVSKSNWSASPTNPLPKRLLSPFPPFSQPPTSMD